MKILIFNWRDIKNPKSGGAEILTHEMAKRWVKNGHQVVQLASKFAGGENNEEIDGVEIIRRGGPVTVYFWAWWLYSRQFCGRFDVVIDEVHGLPFFTPLYVKEKKVVLICEVAREIWFYMYPWPVALLGRTLEFLYFKLYKKTQFLTISPSTKKDLINQSVDADAITILPMGLNLPVTLPNEEKEKKLTLIIVGRLAQMKGIDQAIVAFSKICQQYPDAVFWIVGRGEDAYVKKLKELVVKLDLAKQVKFWGFVAEEEKFSLMAGAHILVSCSTREGWGLTVPEAAMVKTPSVVYDSPGLRDIIVSGRTGIILSKNTPDELAGEVINLYSNHRLYQQIQQAAFGQAEKTTWDKTAAVGLEVLLK
ncbi:glycosyltransferase family 4 protein [Candidatus Daviesbacteria bacterium]|nr:glycosyltransferase family 4 protein [Candidatus Daviesbacteria bacterium]